MVVNNLDKTKLPKRPGTQKVKGSLSYLIERYSQNQRPVRFHQTLTVFSTYLIIGI